MPDPNSSQLKRVTIEEFETQERRDAIDDFRQKVMEMRQEYNKKLAACGEANNFTPFGNCNKCKADCKGAGTCSLTDCREICREDKKILESKKCDLAVDNSVFKNLWRNIGGRRKNKPAPEDAVKNMDNDYKAVPKAWTRHKTR